METTQNAKAARLDGRVSYSIRCTKLEGNLCDRMTELFNPEWEEERVIVVRIEWRVILMNKREYKRKN